jgi:hypothetical protein
MIGRRKQLALIRFASRAAVVAIAGLPVSGLVPAPKAPNHRSAPLPRAPDHSAVGHEGRPIQPPGDAPENAELFLTKASVEVERLQSDRHHPEARAGLEAPTRKR